MLRAVFCTEEQQPQMKDVKTSYVCNFLRFFVLFFGQNSAQFCRKQTADEPKPEFMVYVLVVLFQAGSSLMGNGPVSSLSAFFSLLVLEGLLIFLVESAVLIFSHFPALPHPQCSLAS